VVFVLVVPEPPGQRQGTPSRPLRRYRPAWWQRLVRSASSY